jgi:flagellar secretion chaperone FliS
MKGDELHYLKNSVEAMSRDELVLFLYQELIRTLNVALNQLEASDVENRVLSLHRANEFITTLLNALNYDAGEIAFQLRAIYFYAIKLISMVNINKNPDNIVQACKLFRTLHDAWKEKIVKDKLGTVPMAGQENSSAMDAEKIKKSLECYG